MPRYHFHVRDGQDFPDHNGTVLPDLAAARREAVRLAAELLSEADKGFWTGGEWMMTVTANDRQTVLTMKFSANVDDSDVQAPGLSGERALPAGAGAPSGKKWDDI